MSRILDIDVNSQAWNAAYLSVINGEKPICPHCQSTALDVNPVDFGNGIGYMTITCNDCNKTGYFSRVKFPDGLSIASA